jgi:hypothetical protein
MNAEPFVHLIDAMAGEAFRGGRTARGFIEAANIEPIQ